MNIFFRRHLALFCSVFAATALCGCFLKSEEKKLFSVIAIATAALLVLLSVIIKHYRFHIFKLALCVLFSLLAVFVSYTKIDAPIQKALENPESEITATVEEIYYESDYASSYKIKITDSNGESFKARALLELDFNAMLCVGDVIIFDGLIDRIEKVAVTPQYYQGKGILLAASTNEIEILHNQSGLLQKIQSLNQKLSDSICGDIEGESGKLISALVLGNKELLSPETQRDFRRAGISHVIAISGMHLSVLMVLFEFVLKRLQLGKGVRGGIVLLIALFYLALTGFSLSTVRAFIMTAMTYFAFVFCEDSDMLTNLFFSLFFILLVSPLSVYDIGLWLSFLAVLGIFVAGYFIKLFSDMIYLKMKPKVRYAKRMPTWLGKFAIFIFSSAVITISANTFICVPAWLYFDEISLISVLSNIIVSPFAFIILLLTQLYFLSLPIEIFASALAHVLKLICDLLIEIISFLSSFKGITISLNYKFAAPIVIFLAIGLFVCLVMKFKRKWLILFPPVLAAIVFSLCLSLNMQYYSQLIAVEYVGHGESDMMLIRDGKIFIIIDVSSGAYSYASDAYNRSVENNATEISSYVLTHYHANHQSTLYKLSKSSVINTLYLPYPQTRDEYYQMASLVTISQNAKIDLVLYDCNKPRAISQNVGITLSAREYINRSTHPVFCFSVETPQDNIVYLSDSYGESSHYETAVVQSMNNSKYIILGSHGPKTKNYIDFSNVIGGKNIILADKNIEAHFGGNERKDLNIYSDVVYTQFKIPHKK